MEKVKKKTSRAEQKARRPYEILEAAFEEFTAKGYAATRVEDVAARLGVTKGTIYLYFPTKDVLFEEMYRHASAPMTDLLTIVTTLQGSWADRLRALLLLAYDKTADNRKTIQIMRLSVAEGARFPEIVDRHHDEFIAPVLAALMTLVENGVKAGEFRSGAEAEIPKVLVSSIFQVMVWRLLFADRKPIDGISLMKAHIDLILNGFLNREGAATISK